jgi:hypothetical protein
MRGKNPSPREGAKPVPITVEELEAKFDRGESILEHVDFTRAKFYPARKITYARSDILKKKMGMSLLKESGSTYSPKEAAKKLGFASTIAKPKVAYSAAKRKAKPAAAKKATARKLTKRKKRVAK